MTETTRRAVLVGTCCAGAAAVLAACAPTAATNAAPKAPKKSDIPVGGGVIFDDQKIVVTQPTVGEFKAFSAVCTHQHCTVTRVEDGVIKCPCHGSAFSIADGSVKDGPAPDPLPSKKISFNGDDIVIS